MTTTRTRRARVGLSAVLQRITIGLAAVSLLMAAPAIAEAAFSNTVVASGATSTLTLRAPSFLTASTMCPRKLPGTFVLGISDYGDVPGATSYEVRVTSPDKTTTSTFTTSKRVLLRVYSTKAGTWRYSIRGILNEGQANQWTGKPINDSVSC